MAAELVETTRTPASRRDLTDPARRRSSARSRSEAARPFVRRAGADDVAAIVDMRLALLREELRAPLHRHAHPDAARRARRLTERQLAGAREVVFVAEIGGAPVGMLRCAMVRASPMVRPSRYALLTTAYVRPAHRRRGVLRVLVRAALRWCRAAGLAEMRLHCALTNHGGASAWRALGFEPAEVLHRRVIAKG
jgi:GNAT superfamily N-acetyltransferase